VVDRKRKSGRRNNQRRSTCFKKPKGFPAIFCLLVWKTISRKCIISQIYEVESEDEEL
jgi:hypothetical protein